MIDRDRLTWLLRGSTMGRIIGGGVLLGSGWIILLLSIPMPGIFTGYAQLFAALGGRGDAGAWLCFGACLSAIGWMYHGWTWLFHPAILSLCALATAIGLVLVLIASIRIGQAVLPPRRITCWRCHARMPPRLVCPCGAETGDLHPSIHGILHARCANCGGKLPTLDATYWVLLRNSCAACRTPLEMHHPSIPDVHLALLGAPGSGKSCLMVSALGAATAAGLRVDYRPGERERITKLLTGMRSGQTPAKTAPAPLPPGISALIASPHGTVNWHIFDAAGEDGADALDLDRHRCIDFDHLGLILVLDPLADPDLRAVGEPADPAMRGYEAVGYLGRIIDRLERSGRATAAGLLPTPLAIVLSRGDRLAGLSQEAAHDDLERWLVRRGGAQLLGLARRFAQWRIFLAASIVPGRWCASLQPFAWLSSRAGARIAA